MEDGLAQELVQASQGKGAAVGRREAVHKTAVANQARGCPTMLTPCLTHTQSTPRTAPPPTTY